MRWRLEHMDNQGISGWIYDADKPERLLQVFALKGNAIVGKATASEARPALAGAGHTATRCGFSIRFAREQDPSGLLVLCMNAMGDGKDLIIYSPNKEAIGSFKSAYQSFSDEEGGGHSDSAKKLEKLKLPGMAGLRVLDLGCNEGFFCFHALAQGASRVVGIDSSDWFIEKAVARLPNYAELEAEGRVSFRHASWWDVPDERFDLILFLSAIHYEPRQKALLDFLASRLTPGGMLVLECGVFHRPGKYWINVARSVDVRRYPTAELLLETLLAGYAARYAGDSVSQAGDPVPRCVYYCTPKKPTVFVVRGPSGSGKSIVTRMLGAKHIPVLNSDFFFTQYAGPLRPTAPATPLYQCIAQNLTGSNLSKAGKLLVLNSLTEEFCREFVASLPLDEPLLCIEGEVFSYTPIFKHLAAALKEKGAVMWDVTPEAMTSTGEKA